MRTSIDLPDSLLERIRPVLASRKMTFRALVIDAVEQALARETPPFRLRDASAGYSGKGAKITSKKINQAIDDQRNFPERL